MMLSQKSKIQWHLYGDKNTAAFHNTLKIKNSNSIIHSIHDMEGKMCSSSDSIQNAFLEYFTVLLASKHLADPHLSLIFKVELPAISLSQIHNLIQLVTDYEIKISIFSMN